MKWQWAKLCGSTVLSVYCMLRYRRPKKFRSQLVNCQQVDCQVQCQMSTWVAVGVVSVEWQGLGQRITASKSPFLSLKSAERGTSEPWMVRVVSRFTGRSVGLSVSWFVGWSDDCSSRSVSIWWNQYLPVNKPPSHRQVPTLLPRRRQFFSSSASLPFKCRQSENLNVLNVPVYLSVCQLLMVKVEKFASMWSQVGPRYS